MPRRRTTGLEFQHLNLPGPPLHHTVDGPTHNRSVGLPERKGHLVPPPLHVLTGVVEELRELGLRAQRLESVPRLAKQRREILDHCALVITQQAFEQRFQIRCAGRQESGGEGAVDQGA